MMSGGLQTSSVKHAGHNSSWSKAASQQALCSPVHVQAWRRQRRIESQNCTLEKHAACALSRHQLLSAHQKEGLMRHTAWQGRGQQPSAACAASSGSADSAQVRSSAASSSDSSASSAVLRFLQDQFLPLALVSAMIAG